MTRIFEETRDWFERSEHALASHIPHRHHHHQYDQPDTTQEDVMTLPIIASIEDEARAAGAEISDVWHQVLSRHLTAGNMLAHVGQFVQGAEASPVAAALEKFALGPAGEQVAAKIIGDVAGLLQAQAAPADSTPDAPADPTAP